MAATPYLGDPNAVESPDTAPRAGQAPTVSLPNDIDGGTWANAYQLAKRLADEAAYLKQPGLRRHWQEMYDWNGTNITTGGLNVVAAHPQLATNINGAGSGADFSVGFNPIGTMAANCVKLTAGTVATRYANVGSTMPVLDRNISTTQFSFEQDVCINGLGAGDHRFGVTDGTTALTHFAGLHHTASGVWQLHTDAGDFNITGTTPTNNIWQHFQIIYYGSGTPKGVANANTALIEVYYNRSKTPALSQSGAFLTGGNPFYAVQDARAIDPAGAVGYFNGWSLAWDIF